MRLMWVTLAVAALAGCGDDGGKGGDDLAVPLDMAVADQAMPLPPDLALGGGDRDGSVACAPPGGGTTAQYVWNALTLPSTKSDYAFDVNGDGKVDNQLGSIEAALASQGTGDQPGVDQAIASGQSVTLMDERSADATFSDAACAASSVYAGQPQASPDFSGNGHFTVDAGKVVGAFSGPIASKRFTSAPPPADALVPVVVHLPLFGGVDVYGARVTYVRSGSGAMMGQLNGVIREADIRTHIIPDVAAELNAKVQADPGSSTSQQILQLFDTGGDPSAACGQTCQNLDMSCAKANDGTIGDCEVADNNIINNLFAPDVQMFDAAGNYHPNPANTQKDSLSLGFGFTAVAASF